MRFLLIIVSIQLYLGTACNNGFFGKKQPLASRGILDLREWDLTQDGPVDLTGEWEFYWKQLVSNIPGKKPAMNHPAHYTWVPGIWNNQVVNNEKLSGYGYATYRLRVILRKQSTSGEKQSLALLIHDMGTAYALFVNGKKIAQAGSVAECPSLSAPGYRPGVADFIIEGHEADIILHLSNYHHRKGGAWNKIILGRERSLNDLMGKRLALDFFIIGAIFIMSCYYLALYSMRKKDASYLYFGLFCAIIAIRILTTGEYFLLRIFPEMQWKHIHKIEYLTVYTSIPMFFMFLHSLFSADFNKRVLRIIQILGVVFSFLVIVSPSQFYTHTMQLFQVLSFMFLIYGIYTLILSSARKRADIIPFLIGFAVLFSAVINDFLHNNRIILTGYAVPFGLFVFIFSQGFMLSRRFSRMFSSVENLSHELEDKNRRLIQLDKLKDEFMAVMSHEFKTPLHGIIGLAESLIEVQDESISDESKHNLSLIAVSGKRLADLVNDICDFSRLKNSDIILSRNAADIKTIADIVIALSFPLIGNKKVELLNTILPNEPLVSADENRVQQILHNLISNAIKFTNEGNITISAKVIQEHDNAGWLRVSVADTGIGIAKERHEIIFGSFEQADASISRKYGGAGIGLSIARLLVELHGGELSVESAAGIGSVFSFTLPLYRDQNHKDVGEKELPAVITRNGHRDKISDAKNAFRNLEPGLAGKLLIVDDDAINLQVTKNFLCSEGYFVVSAASGIEAIEAIHQQDFDLILLDVMMPNMSGYDVCTALRKRSSLYELPVIMLTARNDIEDLVLAFYLGANDYLTKPIRRDELVVRVRTLVTLKKTVQAHNEAKFKLLQERMNPHFLFNALNTVHALINKKRSEADAAVIKLADNYRFLIESSSRSLIPFDVEWQFVTNYLELEELRYSDTLSIRLEKKGDFDGVMIPPLTIQPVVENSLKHGIWKQYGSGIIRVSAAIDDSRVWIAVSDNGAGLQSENIYSRSLGNIMKRLNYYFTDVQFNVQNAAGGGVEAGISYCYRKLKTSTGGV